MKERPISMIDQQVRAIMANGMTQTRRVVRKQFELDAEPAEVPATTTEGWQTSGHSGLWWDDAGSCLDDAIRCPFGIPGDRLWVREAWSIASIASPTTAVRDKVIYRADFPDGYDMFGIPSRRWFPSIHLKRANCRILLEVFSVRVERLNDISDADAIAEGMAIDDAAYDFSRLWESLNGDGSWAANPWVWVIEFKRVAE